MRYFVLLSLFLIISSCGVEQQQNMQLIHTHCSAQDGLSDASCTPGAIFPNATTSQICTPGYAQSVRNVPQSEKDQVYAEYGITKHAPGQYEIDHLVSLEIGGSNDMKNLWPELYTGPYNAHMKDQVENFLHAQVCSSKMSLKEAQAEIATNWKAIVIH